MNAFSNRAKSQYTENEVAEELGVSVERLRTLIQDRVMPNEDIRPTAIVTFQPSDLLLLRLWFAQAGAEAPRG